MPDVKVPQSGGTITVAEAGDVEGVTRTVSKDGIVQVAEEDLDLFVKVVPGAEVVASSQQQKS